MTGAFLRMTSAAASGSLGRKPSHGNTSENRDGRKTSGTRKAKKRNIRPPQTICCDLTFLLRGSSTVVSLLKVLSSGDVSVSWAGMAAVDDGKDGSAWCSSVCACFTDQGHGRSKLICLARESEILKNARNRSSSSASPVHPQNSS